MKERATYEKERSSQHERELSMRENYKQERELSMRKRAKHERES